MCNNARLLTSSYGALRHGAFAFKFYTLPYHHIMNSKFATLLFFLSMSVVAVEQKCQEEFSTELWQRSPSVVTLDLGKHRNIAYSALSSPLIKLDVL